MDARWVNVRQVAALLAEKHYLGPTRRGTAWLDADGAVVLAKPTSRRLPQDGTWLELVRWCLTGGKNAGSRQWRALRRAIHHAMPKVTTVVSYSDPSAGHTGALYKACGWIHAPTWHRLRPPPSGNGKWSDKAESVKDRWVYRIRSDPRRGELLAVKDAALTKNGPVGYHE